MGAKGAPPVVIDNPNFYSSPALRPVAILSLLATLAPNGNPFPPNNPSHAPPPPRAVRPKDRP